MLTSQTGTTVGIRLSEMILIVSVPAQILWVVNLSSFVHCNVVRLSWQLSCSSSVSAVRLTLSRRWNASNRLSAPSSGSLSGCAGPFALSLRQSPDRASPCFPFGRVLPWAMPILSSPVLLRKGPWLLAPASSPSAFSPWFTVLTGSASLWLWPPYSAVLERHLYLRCHYRFATRLSWPFNYVNLIIN